MKNKITIKTIVFLLGILSSTTLSSQNIIPDVSARVDTSNIEINKVLHLIKDYLNSRPDSVYINPYWNAAEPQKYFIDGAQQYDRSANQLFYDEMTANAFFSKYRPKILQIDKIEDNRYQIKTIYSLINELESNKSYSPLGITKLYAVKDQEGNFKLENAIGYDIRNWKSYQYQMITYKVHPLLKFNKKRASEAMNFCRDVMKKLNIRNLEPIMYYVTPNSDEMWKLFNFEYMLYYTTGMANSLTREIFTSFGTENFLHELAHLIIPNPDNDSKKNNVIITEGLVTWLAGPLYNSSFSNNLAKVSDKFNSGIHPTLADIITYKYRNMYDSNILYVTGGVICKLAYEQSGTEGVFELYNCPDGFEKLKQALEKVFKMQYPEIEKMVISYIADYKETLYIKPW